MTELKPSHVILAVPPLTACFKKTEAECAAALLIWYMQNHGDSWQPVTPKQLGAAMTDEEFEKEPCKSWNRNPFFRPDFGRLIADGFVSEGDAKALMFTEAVLERLRTSHWVRK